MIIEVAFSTRLFVSNERLKFINHVKQKRIYKTYYYINGFFVMHDTIFEIVPRLEISLAEWSLNRGLKGGTIDHLDFPSLQQKNLESTLSNM
jgi:hypothetical protein